MNGLIAYGTYVPHNRLRHEEVAAALGKPAQHGARAVASFDEDVSSMAVEAARQVLDGTSQGIRPRRLYFATVDPPYRDKTNAALIHAALGLAEDVLAVDMTGSSRSGVGALIAAMDASEPTLVVMSDIRFGPAGSSEEVESGDAAAALLFSPEEIGRPAVEVIAHSSTTREFLDRWRLPSGSMSRVWDDRFGEEAYRALANDAFTEGLKRASLGPSDVDHLIVTGLNTRATRAFAKESGVRAESLSPNLIDLIGNVGAAAPGLALAATLDRAGPGEIVVLSVLADGATVVVLRVTDAIQEARPKRSVGDQIAAGAVGLPYTKFLAWRGLLEKELPRRPDPVAPSPSAAFRLADYKFGLLATKCVAPTGEAGGDCATIHLPPARVCGTCHAQDHMVHVPMSGLTGTIRTFTIDHLVYSPNPPVVSAVLDLDDGGRFTVDLTDVDPSSVSIGDRVEMTFRRLWTANGIHNYFWKGRPQR